MIFSITILVIGVFLAYERRKTVKELRQEAANLADANIYYQKEIAEFHKQAGEIRVALIDAVENGVLKKANQIALSEMTDIEIKKYVGERKNTKDKASGKK